MVLAEVVGAVGIWVVEGPNLNFGFVWDELDGGIFG